MESKHDPEVKDKQASLPERDEHSHLASEVASVWSSPKVGKVSPDKDKKTGDASSVMACSPAKDKAMVLPAIPSSYSGELIELDVKPKVWTVNSGETIEKIAKVHLGVGATSDQIVKHMEEICRINNIGGDSSLKRGMKLELPGHTIDGGFVTSDRQGNLKTVWTGGTEVVQYVNGISVRRWTALNGSFFEEYHGSRPENHFLIKRDDHRLGRIWGDGVHLLPLGLTDASVKLEHERLLSLAERQINHPALLAKFQVDMARFEARSYALEANLKRQGLTEEQASKKAKEEIQNTYKEIARLLMAGNNPDIPINVHRRVDLAQQILSQAATPTSIQQGEYNTCNVGVVEVRTYARQPSEAARLVVDIALSGQFVAKDGTKVTLDTDSLYAHGSARRHPPGNGGRSLANQFFQTAAVNIHYAKTKQKIRYACHEPNQYGIPIDNGERLFDYSVQPAKEVLAFSPSWKQRLLEGQTEIPLRSPGLTCDAILAIGNSISGKTENDWFLVHKDLKIGDRSVVRISSAIDLESKIAQAKEEGKLPLVVYVRTDNEPFYSNSGANYAGGSGGPHVVSIVDYQPGPTPKVSIDNQWRASEDHLGRNQISVQDLYLTLRSSSDAQNRAELQDVIIYQRKNGAPDYLKELDLVRVRKDNHLINESQFEEQLKTKIKQMGRDYARDVAENKVNWQNHLKLNQELDFLVSRLPPHKRLVLIDLERKSGFISPLEYLWKVVNVVSYARIQQMRDHKRTAELSKCIEQLQLSLKEVPSEEAAKIRKQISKRISFYKRVLDTKD